MKIEQINHTDYFIYDYFMITSDVKSIIGRIQKRLFLSGFYRVLVSFHKIGIFLQISKLEDSYYKDTLDLKIESSSLPIYFCTEDYFLIQRYSPLYYLEGKYYCIVDDSFDEILEKVEFGDFVFGEKIEKCLRNSSVIQ